VTPKEEEYRAKAREYEERAEQTRDQGNSAEVADHGCLRRKVSRDLSWRHRPAFGAFPHSASIASSLALICGLSCRSMLNKELWTSMLPL
jgi:hypothetical protein